ncbi:ABC transporter ATP-binding protein [Bacteroidota bacterium]|jgi:ABC-2 type transport system ATP-binding protein|nr:ABC transporter ATP-binding protein [Bacteroidota bacterium]
MQPTIMDSILSLKNLRKHFESQKAVDDISLEIERGQIFGLLGPNGAGKTTLIRMITGIFYPDQGEIFFDGKKFDPQLDVAKIGYMPEERGLYKKMKVGEQALYLAQLKGLDKQAAKQKIENWFGRFGMESWWDKKVEDLSKGMGQKLQFVTTVLHDPSLIILDEPFSGLDPVNSNLIKDEIFRLAQQGSTIIFSTHRMEQVEEICNHIALVNRGKKILDGTVQEIKQHYKQHQYSVSGHGIEKLSLDQAPFTVVSQKENTLVIQIAAQNNSSDVLRFLLDRNIQINAFQELLPSLNDIFIQLVGNTPTARTFEKI